MKKYFANLSSMERRFVVAVLLVVFTALNAWLVWPRFGDWKAYQARKAKGRNTQKVFEEKIAQGPEIEKKIKQLESEGIAVPPEDQAIDFLRTIQAQATACGFTPLTSTRLPERTNQFFLERAQALTLQTTESQFLCFLYNLGAGNSLIRVRGLSLGPDAPRQNLKANVTLVGSYQKKAIARAAAVPVAGTNKPTPPAAKPAPPVPKPATGDKPPAASGVPKPSTPSKK